MSTADPSDVRPARRAFLTRRRRRVLVVVLGLAIVARVALPTLVRRIVVAQADAALVGRLEIDDVDLALLTGGFTLRGLRVFAGEASPVVAPAVTGPTAAAGSGPAPSAAAGEGPVGVAPVFSAARVGVDLGFLGFLRRTVAVQHLDLEGVAVSLDRAKDGTLVLPAAVPAAGAPAADTGPGWGVLIQSVRLRDGRIGFRDFAVGDPAQHVEVTLPNLEAGQLALLITESGLEPGKLALDAGIQDGTLHLEATLENLPAGPAYESHVILTNVPVADSRLYLPKVGWSDLAGRLDADLVHRFESQGAHTLRGTLGLRDLIVRVAGLDDPALAWRTLGIEGAGIDLVARHADLTAVTLTGARLVTRPGGPEPVPVLHGLVAAAAAGGAAAPAAADAAPGPPPAAAVTASVDDASDKAWTWAIGKVVVRESAVQAIGGDGPLDVGVAADVAPLASTPGTHSTLSVRLSPASGGNVELAGGLTLDPLGFDGTLAVANLALAPLTLPVATAGTRLLKRGVVSCDLAIVAGAAPQAPPAGVRVAGTIALADVEVAGDDPKVFALRWKDLAVALGAVTAPGVLASAPGAASGPVDVALTSLALVRPEIVVTRTAQGIALPPPFGGTSSPPAAPASATTVPAAAPPSAQPAVRVRLDRLAIHQLRIDANDTTVKPFYRSALDPVDLEAAALGWPDPSARDVKLVAKGLDGAVFTLQGSVAPAGSRLVAKLTDLPLAPFNPYAAATGYGVGGGTVQLDATIKLGPGRYDTTSRLVLHELDVRGGEGDALFTSRFGMPLSLALALMTDLQGDIVLDLPIAGDAAGRRTGLGTLVGKALARAILNAVTSPLKLIGAVARVGDKPAALAPPPLVFLAGRETLAAGEAEKLVQLARVLAAAPGLRLHVRGSAGDEDRRWLREQALRERLADESGVVGTLRHLGERGARRAVLAALTRGEEVPTEHRDWFERQVAAQSVPDTRLQELAAARAAAVAQWLAQDHGVAAARVVLDEPVTTEAAARPVVTIGLGGGAARVAPPGQERPARR